MVIGTLVTINVLIFLVLSFLHFYWVAGGKWGLQAAIPEEWGPRFESMSKSHFAISTAIVGIGLLLFAIITAHNYYSLSTFIGEKWLIIATRLIGVIFILRSIGDFNVCGIFKKKSDSMFAKKDSRFYVPLCIYLGVTSFLITVF